LTSGTSEVIEALRRAPGIIVPLVQEVPADVVKRRPQPGRWSAHEHACHLAEVQPMFFERLDLMLEEEHPTIRPYLPEQEHDADALLRLDLDEALERLVSDRARLVTRLEGLSAGDWARTAEHGEYSHYSIFILFRHVAMHDMLHAYRIEELLLKRDWEGAGG
jgi:uncharacterized damage-inducible protein DinB